MCEQTEKFVEEQKQEILKKGNKKAKAMVIDLLRIRKTSDTRLTIVKAKLQQVIGQQSG